MMKQRNLTRITVFLCMLLLIFATASGAYAETYYFECRDGGISIYKESGWDSWQIAEVDKTESSGKPFEHIMTAAENGISDPLMFDIYFSADAVTDGDYVYFYSDENDARDYYDKYGKNALVQLYTEQIASADPGAQITYGTPVFTEYQWNSFLKTDIVMTADLDGDGQQESRTDTVFLTASMTSNTNFVINEVLVFHNGYGLQLTQDQQDTAAEIVDEFSEYGYGDDMTGDHSDDAVYYADGISDGAIGAMAIFTVAIVLIIAAAVVAVILRRRKMNGGSAGTQFRMPGSSGTSGMHAAQSSAKRRDRKLRDLHDAHRDHIDRSGRAAGAAGERRARQSSSAGAVMQQAVSSDEQRYLDSLKTLYKSGLLTRAEMNEMIERHQVQNMRRRGGRP
ncbi:hypothetical protein [Brotomerdimonas butyrica]|uniref:hypothetical protein n=1 Tax=Brotomerdimonas butyrica TaxID=2981721 RepID=UPI0011C8E0B9|nr:hypothetical protein [Brotomerdimonas butyrica]MCU6755760.1 hypothetical protein [Brotomerdimonas butyrica]